MNLTALDLLNFSSALAISSTETRRLDKSMYPIKIIQRLFSIKSVISTLRLELCLNRKREVTRHQLPFSLSTLRTTTTSFLPTRINFWILRILRRDNSDRSIIPSMLSYSSYQIISNYKVKLNRSSIPYVKNATNLIYLTSLTYAPISAIWRTLTITRSSTSGYFSSYIRHWNCCGFDIML